MPIFKYKAIGADGVIVEGTQSADDRDTVIANMRVKKQMPISIVATKDLLDISKTTDVKISKVKTKDIAIFCRQFYTMFRAGVPIISCIETLMLQADSKPLKNALSVVNTQLQEGMTLSESLRRNQKAFPELLVFMVEAADVSGNIDDIMLRMSIHYENENRVNAKIKGAMIYPIILSIVLVAVVVALLTFVMPQFLTMFEDSGTALPMPTQILLSVSDALTGYWYFFIAAIVGIVFFWRILLQQDNIRYQVDKIKLKMPYVGTLIKKIITTRFARTLATLISSGISLVQALEITSKICGNKVAERGIMIAAEEASKGISLDVPINAANVFPPMLVSMIRIGEESGTLDELLDQTATFYDGEVETAMSNLTTVIEPVMIVIMSILVGGVVIAMLLPMFGMFEAIDNLAA